MLNKEMKISYAITLCDEEDEFKTLFELLHTLKREEDNIYVLLDKPKCPPSLLDYLYQLSSKDFITLKESAFPGNFADWKNELISMCDGDWIFNIDADEEPSTFLINNLHTILNENPDVDLYKVPRINIVEGITEEHIKKWGWYVNDEGWINYPDYQSRIFKNKPEIEWVGKVHETITGINILTLLPRADIFSLIHVKSIERQEKQNNFYNKI